MAFRLNSSWNSSVWTGSGPGAGTTKTIDISSGISISGQVVVWLTIRSTGGLQGDGSVQIPGGPRVSQSNLYAGGVNGAGRIDNGHSAMVVALTNSSQEVELFNYPMTSFEIYVIGFDDDITVYDPTMASAPWSDDLSLSESFGWGTATDLDFSAEFGSTDSLAMLIFDHVGGDLRSSIATKHSDGDTALYTTTGKNTVSPMASRYAASITGALTLTPTGPTGHIDVAAFDIQNSNPITVDVYVACELHGWVRKDTTIVTGISPTATGTFEDLNLATELGSANTAIAMIKVEQTDAGAFGASTIGFRPNGFTGLDDPNGENRGCLSQSWTENSGDTVVIFTPVGDSGKVEWVAAEAHTYDFTLVGYLPGYVPFGSPTVGSIFCVGASETPDRVRLSGPSVGSPAPGDRWYGDGADTDANGTEYRGDDYGPTVDMWDSTVQSQLDPIHGNGYPIPPPSAGDPTWVPNSSWLVGVPLEAGTYTRVLRSRMERYLDSQLPRP